MLIFDLHFHIHTKTLITSYSLVFSYCISVFFFFASFISFTTNYCNHLLLFSKAFICSCEVEQVQVQRIFPKENVTVGELLRLGSARNSPSWIISAKKTYVNIWFFNKNSKVLVWIHENTWCILVGKHPIIELIILLCALLTAHQSLILCCWES